MCVASFLLRVAGWLPLKITTNSGSQLVTQISGS
jgi:hypothetical protein